MRVHSAVFVAVLAVGGPLSLSAHHSVQGTYDTTKTVTLSGVIAKVNMRNPHATLEVNGKDAGGNTRSWVIQMAGAFGLISRGIDSQSFVIGTAVTVEVWLPKSGADGLVSGSILTTSDGRKLDIADRWGEMAPKSPVEKQR